ncbi:MAG: hypothetical protein BWY92_01558 [Firmicutes bacterium ADurb.BinA052]|nr:MAG: hypothetical protein BWY92_01558 [Firmicutes bacterium ADurb.BinA052]
MIRKDTLISYTKDLTHMLPATKEAFADPFFSTGVNRAFKAALEYATAYPPLGVWGSIENDITGEFKAIFTDYVTGQLGPNGVQQHLNTAAQRVDVSLKNER